MNRLLNHILSKPFLPLVAALALAALGWRCFRTLSVDVFPDIPVPRVVLQTEAPGLTAEEVEQRVTIPLEAAMNGIPGVSTIRSSSSGGLSFVWVDFDWGTDLVRARFDVFERLQRVRETLPREAESEAEDAERMLRQLLGVAPDVKLTFARADLLASDIVVSNATEKMTPLDYVRHPRVRAALCRLDGGEVALETEIRRQYPDLKIGPAYSREEGLDRLGIVAGVALPFWNRNRKGIAEAEGSRNEAKQEAIRIWREVVLEAASADARSGSASRAPTRRLRTRRRCSALPASFRL